MFLRRMCRAGKARVSCRSHGPAPCWSWRAAFQRLSASRDTSTMPRRHRDRRKCACSHVIYTSVEDLAK
jgi:hypothetical protein